MNVTWHFYNKYKCNGKNSFLLEGINFIFIKEEEPFTDGIKCFLVLYKTQLLHFFIFGNSLLNFLSHIEKLGD